MIVFNKEISISMHAAAEDLEAGNRKPKFQTEPTLPIYLKVLLPYKYYLQVT